MALDDALSAPSSSHEIDVLSTVDFRRDTPFGELSQLAVLRKKSGQMRQCITSVEIYFPNAAYLWREKNGK